MGRNTSRNDRNFARGFYNPESKYATAGPDPMDAYFYIKKKSGIPLTPLERKHGYDPAEEATYERVLREHSKRFQTDSDYRAEWRGVFHGINPKPEVEPADVNKETVIVVLIGLGIVLGAAIFF